jgi:hypothetical protein
MSALPASAKANLELAAIAYEQEVRDAVAAGALGFYARLFVQAGMPHSDPHASQHVRSNGALTLTIMAPPIVGLRRPATAPAHSRVRSRAGVRSRSPPVGLAAQPLPHRPGRDRTRLRARPTARQRQRRRGPVGHYLAVAAQSLHPPRLGIPTRNPEVVRQRAVAAARQGSGQPVTPPLDPGISTEYFMSGPLPGTRTYSTDSGQGVPSSYLTSPRRADHPMRLLLTAPLPSHDTSSPSSASTSVLGQGRQQALDVCFALVLPAWMMPT